MLATREPSTEDCPDTTTLRTFKLRCHFPKSGLLKTSSRRDFTHCRHAVTALAQTLLFTLVTNASTFSG
jgi:hypothetical protein